MNTRGLLVASILAALVGAGVWWSLSDEKAKEGKPEVKADAPRLLDLKEADFIRVELKRASDSLTLERQGSGWRITAPAAYAADSDAVSGLLSNLGSLNADKIVDDKPADLGQYGLAAPPLTLAFTTKDKKSRQLKIGDSAPMSGGYYAQLDGDPKVYSIASYNQTNLNKTVADLRDKRLLTFDTDKISRIEIATAKDTYEVVKNNSGEWQIVKPHPMRAESFQIEEILRKIKEAKMDPARSEEDAKKAAAGFAAGQRVALIKITDASGTQEFEVRKQKGAGTEQFLWAKSSVVEGAHKVNDEIGSGVDRNLDAVRNRKVFDFGFSEISRIEYKSLAFEKKGQDWFSNGRKMDNVGIQGLIDKLRDVEAKSFAEPAPANGVEAGEVVISSNAGKRTERVRFVTVGAKAYAIRAGDPAGYEVEPRLPADVGAFAAAIKEAKGASTTGAKKK